MARFPAVEALAEAPVDEVLHLWTGTRVLRTGEEPARVREGPGGERHGGDFPEGLEAVDGPAGNRAFDRRGDSGALAGRTASHSRWQRQAGAGAGVRDRRGSERRASVLETLWSAGGELYAAPRVAHYTQAIMDLGATLCTRARPACTVCPLVQMCRRRARGTAGAVAGSRSSRRERPSRAAVLLIAETGAEGSRSVLVERRPAVRYLGRPLVAAAIRERGGGAGMVPPRAGRCRGHGVLAADRARVHAFRLALATAACVYALLKHASSAVCEAETGSGTRWTPRPRSGCPSPIHQLFERMRNPAR